MQPPKLMPSLEREASAFAATKGAWWNCPLCPGEGGEAARQGWVAGFVAGRLYRSAAEKAKQATAPGGSK